jgi:hypothetical protein
MVARIYAVPRGLPTPAAHRTSHIGMPTRVRNAAIANNPSQSIVYHPSPFLPPPMLIKSQRTSSAYHPAFASDYARPLQ